MSWNGVGTGAAHGWRNFFTMRPVARKDHEYRLPVCAFLVRELLR